MCLVKRQHVASYDVTQHVPHITLQWHHFLFSFSSCKKQILQAVCAYLEWECTVNTGLL